jgi:hypothetical protein
MRSNQEEENQAGGSYASRRATSGESPADCCKQATPEDSERYMEAERAKHRAYRDEQIRNLFSHHPPTSRDQVLLYELVRQDFTEFALRISKVVSTSVYHDEVIDLLSKGLMLTNRAIALGK